MTTPAFFKRTNVRATRKLGSASRVASTDYVLGDLIQRHGRSPVVDYFNVGGSYKGYNLLDVAGLNSFTAAEKNENFAEGLLKSWNLGVCINASPEVPNMREIVPLYVNSEQQPDISIFNKANEWLTNIEVHSSLYSHTLNKAITGGVDMLRYLRNRHDNITEVTVFAFPRKEVKTSVVKVTISFEDCLFRYSLERVELVHVETTLRACLKVQAYALPAVGQIEPFLIKLTPAERKLMVLPMHHPEADDTEQIASASAITVMTSKHCYKRFKDDKLLFNCIRFSKPLTCHRIHCMLGMSEILYYDKVPYDPLSIQDAKSCLVNLIELIKEALDEIHGDGYVHYDVRLPNICFSQNFQAVLIDLETVNLIGKGVPGVLSCMYPPIGDKPTTIIDFMSLGWLVADVLLSTGPYALWTRQSYHDRIFKELPDSFKCSIFLSKLIELGEYSSITTEDSLQSLLVNSSLSVHFVLSARGPASGNDY